MCATAHVKNPKNRNFRKIIFVYIYQRHKNYYFEIINILRDYLCIAFLLHYE